MNPETVSAQDVRSLPDCVDQADRVPRDAEPHEAEACEPGLEELVEEISIDGMCGVY